MDALGDRNLRSLVAASDRSVLGRRNLVPVDGHRTRAGGQDIFVVSGEVGDGDADGIAGVELIHGRNGNHGGVGGVISARMVLGAAVGKLHHINGVVGGDVKGHRFVFIDGPPLF